MDIDFTVRVSGHTIEIDHQLYGLRMAAVPANWRLGEWRTPGVYILFGTRIDGSSFAYVGQARYLNQRIAQHTEFEWNRALLISRSIVLDTAQRGWLEGRIYAFLEANDVDLENKQRPGDDTIDVTRQRELEKFVEVIEGALVLLGYDSMAHQHPAPKQTPVMERRDTDPVTIGKVHRKLLDVVRVGDEVEAIPRKYSATATVEDTGIRYGGELYSSPSAAAKAVAGTDTADGWSFWGLRSESGAVMSLRDLRSQARSEQTSPVGDHSVPKRRTRSTKLARQLANFISSVHDIDVGTQIESTWPKYPATATIEAEGIVVDGELYESLSAAARAVNGADTANGWSFWGLRTKAGLTKLKDLR